VLGIFKAFGKKEKLSSSTVDYLNKVDLEYMQSFATKTTRQLKPFMSPECVTKVSRRIFADSFRYFGAAKFRKTFWTIESVTDTSSIIRKSVVFDEVRVCKSFALNVAENYEELWTLSKDNLILDIQQV